ncbi:DUF4348 domain-containing protein [Flavobacterium poyangense]|uniref:DUF4348 domain-containing protein n=1 Tax=Flavobacterium poyangense TaxID=2204302 RepID=UPI00141E23BE|nr:DUF4348 domain-containing protein [Flavobacterium sp. JXAS1]
MKITQPLTIVILVLFLASCKKNPELQNDLILKQETKNRVANQATKPKAVTNKNEQEDFNEFFKLFNQDTIFQLSRIQFPLTIKINNADLEEVDYIIYKEKYTAINLDKEPESRDYKQHLILKKDQAIIQQRGTNNGIFIDYFFEKKEGKWQLITWVDLST